MKRTGFFLFFFFLFPILILNAQKIDKRPLTINDFAAWKVVNNPIVSNDGKLAAFEINPQKGDGNLVVKSIDSKNVETLSRGFEARFSPESDFIVYKIKQPEDYIRSAKKKKLKKEEMPKDSLGILDFSNHKIYAFPNLKQYTLPKENARWVAFLIDMKKKEKSPDQPKPKKEKDETTDKKYQLVLFQLETGDTICFQNVTEYYYAPKGHSITFIRQTNDSVDHSEIIVFNTGSGKSDVVYNQAGTAKKITSDDAGAQYGFLFSTDTIPEKVYALYYGSLTSVKPKAIATSDREGLPIGWSPSENGELTFSENGLRMYFGTNNKPQPEPKDTLLDDEKPVLDIWNWKDKELQSVQKVNLEKDKSRTYKAVYHVDKDEVVQLGDPEIREIKTIQKGNGNIALGSDPSPYKLESSWTGESNADYYLVDVGTGSKRMIVQNKALVSLSPGGNFVAWFDPTDSSYFARSTNENSEDVFNLSSKIPVSFVDERWDMPGKPVPYGIAGWSENDKYLFIYDRYDIWRVDMEGVKVPVNTTRNYGRKTSFSCDIANLIRKKNLLTPINRLL
jgi:hypothetical protein